MTEEQVVLLDEAGLAVGSAPKRTVHNFDTPLHLAFSCYVFKATGEVLLTRRVLTKLTWPGVWTNSCCGHPMPGEPVPDAVVRRLREELGLVPDSLDLLLPRFRYRAMMEGGIIENEICPVFRAWVAAGTVPRPNPYEVAETRWVSWRRMEELAADLTQDISPWCRAQVQELHRLGADGPLCWRAGLADATTWWHRAR